MPPGASDANLRAEMKTLALLWLLLTFVLPAVASDYHFGADLSGMDPDAVFNDEGIEKPGLQVFRDHGYNWVRYRLWHTPTRGEQDLEYVIARAREARGSASSFSSTTTTPTGGPIP